LKNELKSRENSNSKLSMSKIRTVFKKAFKTIKGNLFKHECFSKKTFVNFKEDNTVANNTTDKPIRGKSKTDLEKYQSQKVKKNRTNLLEVNDKKELDFSGYENQDELFKRIQSNLGDNFKNFFNFSYDKYHENYDENQTKTIDSFYNAPGGVRDSMLNEEAVAESGDKIVKNK
jgi:hypothetical protein